jgi:hypothetical protein
LLNALSTGFSPRACSHLGQKRLVSQEEYFGKLTPLIPDLGISSQTGESAI